ncbi:MAG: hypothetical protein HY235_10660 [Acidobacteria bacterium]|nr:hypothetical protein [Acidobacteriota bacterium]
MPFPRTALIGISLLCLSGAQALFGAAIIIDDFNNPAGGQAICAGVCGGVPSSSSLPVIGVIGGDRDMRVVRDSGGGRVDGNANAFDLGDLTFGAVAASGTLFLQYDGFDADASTLNFLLGGGAGINFFDSVGVLYQITSPVDTGGTVSFRFYTSAGNFIERTDVIPALAPAGPRMLDFSSSTTTGVFDLTAVRAIEVTFVGNTNLDLTIDFIETYTPEPVSASLTGLGLLALSFAMKALRKSN